MTTTITRPNHAVVLPVRMRLPSGRVRDEELPDERHRRIHLALLHADSDGYAEIAAGPRTAGRLRVTTRKDPGHFLPGGATGDPRWLDRLVELAGCHAAVREEVFVGPAVRRDRAASKQHVSHTHWLWIDIDGPDRLPAVRQFARRKAPQLVIASAVIRSDRSRSVCGRAVRGRRHVVSEADRMAWGGSRVGR